MNFESFQGMVERLLVYFISCTLVILATLPARAEVGIPAELTDFRTSYIDQEITLKLSDYTPELLSEYDSLTPKEQTQFLERRRTILNRAATRALNRIRWREDGLKVGGKRVAQWDYGHIPHQELHAPMVKAGVERILRDIDIETLRSAKVLTRKSQVGIVLGGGVGALLGFPKMWFKGGSIGTALILIYDFKSLKFSANWVFDKDVTRRLYASAGVEVSANAFIGVLAGNDYLYSDEPHRVSRDFVGLAVREVSNNHRGLYLLGAITFPPFPLSMLSAYTFETTRSNLTRFDVNARAVEMSIHIPFLQRLFRRAFGLKARNRCSGVFE